MTGKSYKESPEWQKAIELAEEVDKLTKELFKAERMHGRTTAQHVYNRDAESIALDIATAEGRKSIPSEYLRFLTIAKGATFRLATRLLLDVKRNYIEQSNVDTASKLCDELGEMLGAKIETLSAEARAFRLNRQIRPDDFRTE